MSRVILLADDSPDDELFFKDALRDFGIVNPVRVVRDGVQVIAYLKGEGVYADRELYPMPGILFLDLLMPRADGWVVLQWLQNHPLRAKLTVIVLTGQAQAEKLQEAYSMGADSFLLKPLQRLELEGLVHYLPAPWLRAPDPEHSLQTV